MDEAASHSIRLSGGPEAARRARHEVLARFAALDAGLRDTLGLLVTELVANAVRHSRDGEIGLDAVLAGGVLHVTITDPGGDGFPTLRRSAVEEPGGLGLRLVEQLARRWGVTRDPSGRTEVWFELGDGSGAELGQLVLSERRFRSLVQSYSDFIWRTDGAGNPAEDIPFWTEVTGQSRDELFSLGWQEAVHPDDRESVSAAWRESVRTGALFDVSYRVVSPAGETHQLQVRGAPVRDAEGEIAEWIGICTDVTERDASAEEARRLQVTLELVIAQAPTAVAVLTGPEFVYRYFNERYLDLVPPGRQIAGLPLSDALPEAVDAVVPLLERVLAGETVSFDEFPVPFEDERSFEGNRYYDFTYSPITDAGRPAGVLVVAIEATEQVRRRSDLQRRLEAERRLAEELQRAVLPEESPSIAGVELAIRYVPAALEIGVGGDWYDVVELPDGRVLLAIGDVCGRGLAAATAMTQLRSAARAYAIQGDPPGAIMRHLNAYCIALRLADMVTVAAAILDPGSGRLVYASAGHPPPLLVATDGVVTLAWTPVGPPVGVAAGDHPETELSLAPGAALVLYTDGLVEERTRPLDDTLADLCASVAGPFGSAGELCGRVSEARLAGASGDDVALLVCRRAA